jgi:hypothetical protein
MENKVIDLKSIIEEDLLKIKNEYGGLNPEIFSRGFIAPECVQQDTILFLGMNASFSEGGKWDGIGWCRPSEYKDNPYPYFNKFREIAEYCKRDSTHLDILFFRETNQNMVKEFWKDSKGLEFLYKQMCLSKKTIELSKPCVIVVANALVRDFLGFNKNKEKTQGVWMDYDFEFDDNIGTYRIKTQGNLYDIPIFFTSMLSGQRALDNGSFERLKWHIKFALEKNN